MDKPRNDIVVKLFTSIDQFNKINWSPSPVSELNRSEIFTLLKIKKVMMDKGSLVKVSDISKYSGVTPPTITPIITSLENKGYLARSISKNDRRIVQIELTEKGLSTIEKATELFYQCFDGLVEYLGEEKSKEFVDILIMVLNYFNNLKEDKQ